jgi:hypothetical protein
MDEICSDELGEVGRLLGRNGGVLLLHGGWSPERLMLLRQGAASNSVPPIVVQATDERAAIEQGLAMLRPDDVLFVLAENAQAVVRLISRQVGRAHLRQQSIGAA